MDGRGWVNPEWRGEKEADDAGGVDGLGGKSEEVVCLGVGGGIDGGVRSGVDDTAGQLFYVEKK